MEFEAALKALLIERVVSFHLKSTEENLRLFEETTRNTYAIVKGESGRVLMREWDLITATAAKLVLLSKGTR